GPGVALQLEEAGDERTGVVERAPRQVELVLAFLLLDLGAPDQPQVGGRQTRAFVRCAAIDTLGVRPAREQQALVEAGGLVLNCRKRLSAGVGRALIGAFPTGRSIPPATYSRLISAAAG
ncbi:MAG: hypothetical protein L0170_04820, partial [Acidobacteria bacterium]|nr:hypothetical protein [Acidobacteriota bacterium]